MRTLRREVTETPTRALFACNSRLTAASVLAFLAGPISWIGYQY